MAATAIAFPPLSRDNTARGPSSFGDDDLARLRGGDETALQHFHEHFRRLLRLKFWGQFEGEQGEALANDVLAAAREKIAQGEVNDASRLPGYILGLCATLAPPAAMRQEPRATREQLRAFFRRRGR